MCEIGSGGLHMHSLPSTSKGQPVARQAARRCRAGEERNPRCARSWWDRALLWVDGGYDKNMQAATSGQWSPRSGAIEHLRSHTVGSWLPSASGSTAPLPRASWTVASHRFGSHLNDFIDSNKARWGHTSRAGFDAQESLKGELVSSGQQSGAGRATMLLCGSCSPFMENTARVDAHLPGLCFALR